MILAKSRIHTKSEPLWSWLVLYLIAYLLLTILPMIKYSVPYLLAGAFCLLPLLAAGWRNSKYGAVLLVLFFWGALQGLVAYLTGNAAVTELINEPVRAMRYFVPCVLYEMLANKPRRQQRLIWLFSSFLMLFVLFSTLTAVTENPMIARLLAGSVTQTQNLNVFRMQNVGGFEFCYAVGFTTPVWIYLLLRGRWSVRIACAAALLLVLYFAFQVQYMTLLLLLMFSISLTVALCTQRLSVRIGVTVATLLLVLLLPTLFEWISGFEFLGMQLKEKFFSLSQAFAGTGTLNDTSTRFELYRNALWDFIRSPLWGTVSSEAAVHSHSTFLGTAAASGIIGLGFVIWCMRRYYRHGLSALRAQNIDTKPFSSAFMLFLVLAMLNPVQYCYEISAVLFFYIPLTVQLWMPKFDSESLQTTSSSM